MIRGEEAFNPALAGDFFKFREAMHLDADRVLMKTLEKLIRFFF